MPATFDRTVDILKAVAEPTRLRLLLLLGEQDLTVTDLTAILGQSQPRISRHLKLLVEAGSLVRHQEGAFAYFRVSDDPVIGKLIEALRAGVEDPDGLPTGDRERLDEVRRRRAERAARYFAANAAHWDRIRSLYVPDEIVERAILDLLGEARFEALLDVGTGTGRILELLAPHADRSVGIDASREMLLLARAKLDAAGLTRATVRQGDAYRLGVPRGSFDLVTLHQVLHHLDDPASAIREAGAALKPGGRLVIVDFSPHELEFLRDHAHLRLGFSQAALRAYLVAAGLEVETMRELPPAQVSGDALTVTLVLARRPEAAVAPLRPERFDAAYED